MFRLCFFCDVCLNAKDSVKKLSTFSFVTFKRMRLFVCLNFKHHFLQCMYTFVHGLWQVLRNTEETIWSVDFLKYTNIHACTCHERMCTYVVISIHKQITSLGEYKKVDHWGK